MDKMRNSGNQFSVGNKVPTRLISIIIAIGFQLLFQIQLSFKLQSQLNHLSSAGVAPSRSSFTRSETPPSVTEIRFTHNIQEVSIEIENTTLPKHDVTKHVVTSTSETPLSFPETRFTHHVREVVGVIEDTTLPKNEVKKRGYWPEKYCKESVRIVVDNPFSAPSRIECTASNEFCTFVKNIFASNATILPYNVSVGSQLRDFGRKDGITWGICISSSSAKGSFTMTNFQDYRQQTKEKRNVKGFVHNHTLGWEDRQKIPVFRGNPRILENSEWEKTGCPNVTEMGHRVKAVDFSIFHPHLLDAAVSFRKHKCRHYCCTSNQTDVDGINRIFRLGPYSETKLPPVIIPTEEYYTNYQTAVVLGGIGAAFRTGRHFSAGQAVVLQDFQYEEWFTSYMTPHVHYIPLKEDLSNLKEVMEWVRDNPVEVKKIAEQGNKFYWDYLSFDQTDKHWHELLWRLSLSFHEKGSDRLKYGKGRGIWPAPIVPYVFERGHDGDWKVVNTIQEELSKEDAALANLTTKLLYLPGQWQGGVALIKSKNTIRKGR